MSSNKHPLDIDFEDVPIAKRMHSTSTRRSSTSTRRSSTSTRRSSTSTRRSSKLSSDAISESGSDAISEIDLTRDHDKYCWKCHKESNDEVLCSTCPISYHIHCAAEINQGIDDWKCLECETALNVEESLWNGENLGKYIGHVFERTIRSNGTFSEFDRHPNATSFQNPVTFGNIERKVKKSEYSSMNSFLMDLKWLLHNVEVQRIHSKYNKMLIECRDGVKNWIESCIYDFNSIKKCVDCYLKNNSTKKLSVCSKPHIVVWVQYGIYPYWPCKLLGTDIDEPSKIEVAFFDEKFETALVNDSNCYLYSKNDPNQYITDQFKNEVKTSIEAAGKYIKEVEKQFGPFQYAPLKVPLNKEKMDNEHLDFMIPGFRDLNRRPQQHDSSPVEAVEIQEHNDVKMKIEPDSEDIERNLQSQALQEQPSPGRIRLPTALVEEMQFCRKYIIALQNKYDSQNLQINKLSEENNVLKRNNIILKSDYDVLKDHLLTLANENNALKAKNNAH